MRQLRIPLRAVFYRENDVWFAHCLEMDLMGEGTTPEEALAQMSEAIRMQVEASIAHRNIANIFQPADAKFFEMFAAGKDFVVGETVVAIESNDVHVDRLDARQYDDVSSMDEDFACV